MVDIPYSSNKGKLFIVINTKFIWHLIITYNEQTQNFHANWTFFGADTGVPDFNMPVTLNGTMKSCSSSSIKISLLVISEPRCKGQGSCCSSGNKCEDGDGDCDSGSDCISGICGEDNCDTASISSFESSDDCCLHGK